MTVSVNDWSTKFLEAEKTGVGIEPPSKSIPDLDIKEAYEIQIETINSKLASGQKITGKKIGLTSKAMQQLLGVNEPDYGHLLDGMEVENGAAVPRTAVLQPKVEGEIAFILKKDLCGPNVTAEEVIAATDYVAASIEVVDSRVLNWNINLLDTVADNASSGLYVLSDKKISLSDIDLPSIQMKLFKNEEFVNEGRGDAVLGNPVNCVAWLANKLHEFGITLNAGEVILSGALSAAVEAKSGDCFLADFGDKLGKVSINFE